LFEMIYKNFKMILGFEDQSMVIHYLLQMYEDMKTKATIKQHEQYKESAIHMHRQASL
jgi:hypothetical protein